MTNGQFRLDTLSLLESDNQNVIQCSGLDETVLEVSRACSAGRLVELRLVRKQVYFYNNANKIASYI